MAKSTAKFCPKINNLCRSDCAMMLQFRNQDDEIYELCAYESMARDLDSISNVMHQR